MGNGRLGIVFLEKREAVGNRGAGISKSKKESVAGEKSIWRKTDGKRNFVSWGRQRRQKKFF